MMDGERQKEVEDAQEGKNRRRVRRQSVKE